MEISRRILISRETSDHTPLANFCASNSIELVSQRFINIEVIPNIELPKTDWIFFSSPTSVTLFFENYSLEDQKVAVVGKGTNKPLVALGIKADFVGAEDNEPREVGEAFSQLVTDEELVLFPLSQLSRKNVSAQIRNENKLEVVFYETTPQAVSVDGAFDLYIFTSPSNVDGFLLENELKNGQYIICMGETTEKHLKSLNAGLSVFNLGTNEENWFDKIVELIPPQ